MRKRFLTIFFLMIVAMFSCSLLACKEKPEQSFDVSFYSETGELVNTVNTEDKDKFGSELSNKVEKLGTEKFEYKFVGWYTSEEGGKKVESLKDIDSETSLYPRFEEVLKRFDVKYHDAEGNLIFTANVGYGSPADYIGYEPEKAGDNTYNYVFTGWDTETTYVTENIDVYPTYEPQFKFYEITFVNYDGTVLQTSKYTYDAQVSYNGKIPTKVESESHYFEFLRWDKQVTNVTGNRVYTALFREIKKQFSVDFYIEGELYNSKLVYYGDNLLDIPDLPIIDGFEGEWDSTDFEHITENIKVNAVYNPIKYTVSFDMAGATTNNCSSLVLLYDEAYTLPDFDGYRFGYEFVGWEKDGVEYLPGQSFKINEKNVTYTAKWKELKYSLYQGKEYFEDIATCCTIYMFENNELLVFSKIYKKGEEEKLISNYSVSIVTGVYEFEEDLVNVRLNKNYTYTYNTGLNIKTGYSFSLFNEQEDLHVTTHGNYILDDSMKYELISTDNYISDNFLPDRKIIGVALDRNPIFVKDWNEEFGYAIVMYSDLTIDIVNEFSVENFSTETVGMDKFNININNSNFVFEYNVITLEESLKIDYANANGDQLYLVGADIGVYFYNVQYGNGYKFESKPIDKENISGFDTSTPGVKTLTFNIEEGIFTFDIYVLEDASDIIYFESYRDTFLFDVREYGYNVFMQNSEVLTLGVKYANCSVSYEKAFNGADVVDSYVVKEIDVSSYNISTSECGFYKTKVEIEGKTYEIEYMVVDETTYNTVDGYKLNLDDNSIFLVDEIKDIKVCVSYGYGCRFEYVNVNEIESAEIKGYSINNKGITNIYLIIDGNIVDSKQIIILENENDLLLIKDYYSDKNSDYLYENVFILGQQVNELSIKYSQTIYSYLGEQVRYTEGLEIVECELLDTSSLGTKTYTYIVNNEKYFINYLVVEENDYITVSDFNVIGQLSYIIDEKVELKLELEIVYGDNYRKEIISADGFISEYDNKSIGAKKLTITYSGITKNFIVYYYDSAYGFIDYEYYEDYILDTIEYNTENIFYQNQVVDELKVNQVSARRFYNGREIVEKSIVVHKLQTSLDTSLIGEESIFVQTLNNVVRIEYNVLNKSDYFNETGYNVVGKKVLTSNDAIDLTLVIEFANGARHEIVEIKEEDVFEFSRENIGQQIVFVNYNCNKYLFSLFNYVPERDDTSDFIEVEYYDTSLEDYYNSIPINNKNAEFMAKVTYKIYNIYGELTEIKQDYEKVYSYIEDSSIVGVYICEINLLGKVVKVQYVVE